MTGTAQQDDKEMVMGFSQGLGSPRLQQNTSDSCPFAKTQLK